MDIQVGTIVKWYDGGVPDEMCVNGQCVGKVTNADKVSVSPDIWMFTVKWWELCAKHEEIDRNGTGPYKEDYLIVLGQIN